MSLPFEGAYTPSQLRRWLDAMSRRFSCRQFSQPADSAQLATLAYAAQRVSLKGIRIALVKEGGENLVVSLPFFPRFEGLQQYAVLYAKEGTDLPAFRAGISGQALALEMAAQGLQSCWMTGNYRRAQAMEQAQEGEKPLAVMPFGWPRDPEGARLSRRRILTAFSTDDPTQWPYWAYRAAEAMRSAPSAMNRQPWQLSYAGSTLSFTGSRLDSVDTGIALLHLECALGGYPRAWRLAGDGRTLLARLLEDTREPV
ncbi:MAG: hypothetical protein GXY84_01725 [Clostridiales bacterium]|nr:hypothetical protein [Clostridiales bacterium]